MERSVEDVCYWGIFRNIKKKKTTHTQNTVLRAFFLFISLTFIWKASNLGSHVLYHKLKFITVYCRLEGVHCDMADRKENLKRDLLTCLIYLWDSKQIKFAYLSLGASCLSACLPIHLIQLCAALLHSPSISHTILFASLLCYRRQDFLVRCICCR